MRRLLYLSIIGLLMLPFVGLQPASAQDSTPEPCDVDALLHASQAFAAQAQTALEGADDDLDAALSQLYAIGAAYQTLAVQCGYVDTRDDQGHGDEDHDDEDHDEETAHDSGDDHGAALERALAVGDPESGEALFNVLIPQVGFACATCHRVDTTEQLIGPGLLGVGSPDHDPTEHAMDGMATPAMGGMAMGDDHDEEAEHDPAEYIRTSILHPNEYVVPGFPENLMPQTYGDILSEDQINDLVAYLLTL